MTDLAAKGIRLAFLADLGLIEGFAVTDGGRDIAPLHRAPWVGSGEAMPDGAAPHIAHLGGDFFCAPFGGREDGSPMHGWPANGAWTAEAEGSTLHATLDRTVQGARLTKTLLLRDDHPFVYQTHVFEGGSGEIAVANHANVSLPNGGLIATSPKVRWQTPPTAQEPDPARGRSRLAYPARATDPAHFPAVGGTADLTRYPWGDRHEDFVAGLEGPGHALGWTAVSRPAEGDLYLSLRDPRRLPMTMLWHSNGGRDYAPWSGRHRGCLGVEEGAAAWLIPGADGLCGPGALTLGGRAQVRHVTGAVHWPSGEAVSDVRAREHELVVTGAGGATRTLPFDAAFLGLAA